MSQENANEIRDEYTRVTTVLYPFSGLQSVDSLILSKAAQRGTAVHNICEAIVKGAPVFGITEETKPYVDSFLKWYDPEKMVVKEVEKRFWDDNMQITGQVDFIMEDEDGLSLVDLKTSYRPSKTWPLQGNAYAFMAMQDGYKIDCIKFIKLNKNGNKPTIYKYEINADMFIACYKVYNMFFKDKK